MQVDAELADDLVEVLEITNVPEVGDALRVVFNGEYDLLELKHVGPQTEMLFVLR